MIVAGFDLATNSGFAVLDGAKVLQIGAFRAKGETDGEVFTAFRFWFRGLLRDHKIERVAIEQALVTDIRAKVKGKDGEDTGETRNPVTYKTYLRLYGLRAIAIQSVAGLGLPAVLEVHQSTWRKSFTGNARAKKEETLALAQRIVPGLTSKDGAEALGVAWHLNGVLRLEKQIVGGTQNESRGDRLLVGRVEAHGDQRLLER